MTNNRKYLGSGFVVIDSSTYFYFNEHMQNEVVKPSFLDRVISPFGLPVPVSVFDLEISNQEGNLSVKPEQGNYQWINFSSGNIPGANGFSFTPQEFGLYAVSIIDENGCEGISECNSVVVSSTMENQIYNEVHLFPNPTNTHFEIINLTD